MVYAGVTIGSRRPLVKNVFGGRTPGLDALVEYAISTPEFEYFPFSFRKTDFAVYRPEHV
jgi:hypothetical protein